MGIRAVVTGAAGGIGSAVARQLALDASRRGGFAHLLLIDLNNDGLEQTASSLSGDQGTVASATVDLSGTDAGTIVADAARDQLGGVDVLVSNAGVTIEGLLHSLELSDYEKTFAINTRATWLLARAMYPLLKESRGCVVVTASVAAEEPTPPLGAYSASKAAVVMLTRQLAYEWGPDGIRCNCVSPGMVHTPMTDHVYSDPERRAEKASRVPLRRVGTPEDIATAVAFLASSDASYITGANLAVDGGLQTALMPTIRV